MAADWWNPQSWIQSIGSLIGDAAGAATAIPRAVGGLLAVLQGLLRLFTDTGHFVQDAVGWLTNALFPPELQTWFLGTIGAPGKQWDPTQIYQGIYQSMQAPALLVAGAGAASRLVQTTLDHRIAGAHAVFAVLPRFLLAVLIIGIPGTDVSLGYEGIVFAVNGSVALAQALFHLIFNASLLQGVRPGEGWFSHLYQVIANAGHSIVAVVVGGIPLLILLIYAAFLMIVRTIMIGFCIVTAPLCFATAVFDSRNRFFQWWLDLFVGALMTPLVFAVSISLSVTLASSVVSALAIGPILAFVIVCGGLWFSAKMVHSLTWRQFSHGSALAGFAAGVSTMLGPLHKFANAGFMAEALGANREGGNHAVNFMKRMGLASQGFNPVGGSSPAMLAASGSGISSAAGREPDVLATDGPPDVTSALSVSGRSAVAGVEALFSQKAFNSFAHGHTRLVGALTRDQPYGSMPPADRAKLAWSRAEPRVQTGFADEFLSVWLGGVPSVDVQNPGLLNSVASDVSA
jgi:hypothetical protein